MAFITHKGRTLCYRLLGNCEKPLLVLAHPLGMSQSVWDDMLAALLSRFQVLTWDLPGHGASSAWLQDAGEISPQDLADEALTLVKMAGADRFHFVGTSIGGVIGQQLIAESSDLLISATLTNTGAVIGTPEAWATRAADVRTKGLAAMAGEIVPRWFGPQTCTAQPNLLAGWEIIMGRGDDSSYARLCEMLGKTDFRARLQGCDLPLFLIGGAYDIATPPASLRELAKVSGAKEPVIIEDVGHVPSVENPSRLSAIMLENLG
tara:strand:- start:2629 stop:3417 length:789 start_codon:yes stop_codon:yes gene_type:complete